MLNIVCKERRHDVFGTQEINANLLLFMLDCVCMPLYRMYACIYFLVDRPHMFEFPPPLSGLLLGLVFCKTARCKNTTLLSSNKNKSQTKSRVYINCKIIFSIFSKKKMCSRKVFNWRFSFLKKKRKQGEKKVEHSRTEIKVECYLYTRSCSLHTSVSVFVDDPSCSMGKCDHLCVFFSFSLLPNRPQPE